VHIGESGVWSLETFDLLKNRRAAPLFDMVKIDQTFFYTPCKLLAAESKVAFLNCDPLRSSDPRPLNLTWMIAGDVVARLEDWAYSTTP
jgi:hypothetical protein